MSYFRSVFLLFLAALIFPSQSRAIDPQRLTVESRLEQFHLDAAWEESERLEEPAYTSFYKANILLYKYLCSQDAAYSEKFRDGWKETLHSLESLPKTDPMRDLLLAELYGKRAALEFMQENYFPAVRFAKTCRSIIRDHETQFPNMPENKKLLAVFNIAFSEVPRKYQWLTNMFGFKGDLQEGLTQLEEASQKSTLLRLESQFIAHFVEKNVLSQPEKAIKRIQDEKKRSGPTILMEYALATAWTGMKKNDQALAILEKRSRFAEDPDIFYIVYWDYNLGKSYYYKEDYTRAQIYFSKFLNATKGALYRTDATFRLGMALTLDGHYDKAKAFFSRLANEKNSGFDEDNYAFHMAQHFAAEAPSAAIQDLFRARNLYDGGYFTRAETVLNKLNQNAASLSAGDLAELHYRYGRLYHATDKPTEASLHYRTAIEQADAGDQRWMQVYAWYYLGEIARSQGKKEEAREAFKTALKYNDYYYQAGLETKCKTALSEMK
jgi:tetratricopeptide (TPR) repeat protein